MLGIPSYTVTACRYTHKVIITRDRGIIPSHSRGTFFVVKCKIVGVFFERLDSEILLGR